MAILMPDDIGTPSAPSEGTTLPPPRTFGETTTLTLPSGGLGMSEAAWPHGVARFEPPAAGQCAPLRAAILQVAPVRLTITF